MNQEIIQALGQLNQQHENLQEQLKIVDQQINELSQFKEELAVIDKNHSGEAVISLGKSVFAPVKMVHGEKMFIEIGAGYFVKKTNKETSEVIDDQTKKLEELKKYLSSELGSLTEKLEGFLKSRHA